MITVLTLISKCTYRRCAYDLIDNVILRTSLSMAKEDWFEYYCYI